MLFLYPVIKTKLTILREFPRRRWFDDATFGLHGGNIKVSNVSSVDFGRKANSVRGLTLSW